MAKKDSGDGGDGVVDDINTPGEYVVIDKLTRLKAHTEVRRCLENVLEDKELERLINDDFYGPD